MILLQIMRAMKLLGYWATAMFQTWMESVVWARLEEMGAG